MAKLCPACSKANPATANYCYYDGRHLSLEAREGPLQVGALPLPMPFYFPDGQTCANFNQLALACDARWDEARGLLADGTWQSYFGAIGRLDLSAAAKQAAREPDLDVGLSQLLEKFPTDPNALRRPQLSLPSAEENLGTLTPGTDRRFELMISNRGLLVLRGMATTNCDWLSLGDGAGAALKMFQTRGIYTLPVRVLGNRLRAGAKPLQGDIVIDTNGGAITVPVRAEIPVRPFPGGAQANVLAGAKTPRQLAVKAKANPKEAAALFEQGAVKSWYASNGWTYPVQGTQASGKAAVQQFFEALGLSKPPRLKVDTESLLCKGRAGRRLTKLVTISTEESRLVYAQAWSSQDWIKAGPGKSEGNKVTIPLHIEVPPRPGETFQADVTVLGNGQQRFVVPVTLAVSAARSDVDAEEEGPPERLSLGWIFAGVCLLLVVAAGVGAFVINRRNAKPAIPPTLAITKPETPAPAPAPKNEAWWDGIPDTNLATSAFALEEIAPEDQAIFDGVAAKDEEKRGAAYKELEGKLTKLLGDPKAKEPLGRLLTECCVFEPSANCMEQLGQALTSQIPRDGVAFQPDQKGEELERGLWSLQVFFGAIKHKAVRPERVRSLALDLGRVFGDAFEESAPPDQLQEQAEQLFSQRCYRNTLPTAKKSIEHALAMRDVLIQKFPQYLTPAFRLTIDLGLLAEGLSRANDAWPKIEPILKSCLESTDPAVGKRVVDLYKNTDPAAAKKMEPLLASKWKVVGDAKLTRDEKVQAIQESEDRASAAAKISLQERMAELSKLSGDALSSVKAEQKKETVVLRDTVRLAHASTLACALYHKDAGVEQVERFDDLVKQIPDVDQTDQTQNNPPAEAGTSKKPAAKGKAVDGRVVVGILTTKSEADPSTAGSVCREYPYFLQANQPYTIYVLSRAFNAQLRVEDSKGVSCGEASDFGILGRKVVLTVTPTEDGDYQVIVSTPSPGKRGTYDLQVSKGFPYGANPFFGPRVFGPGMRPVAVRPQPAPQVDEKKDKKLNPNDFYKLDSKISTERVAAFDGLAGSDLNDLTPPQAQKLAKYLLVIDLTEDELEKVQPKLESFGECRYLLLALADVVGDENTPIAQKRHGGDRQRRPRPVA